MHDILNENLFLVKSYGSFRAANYDIYDPKTCHITMECREKRLGIVTKIFRHIGGCRMTPFDFQVRLPCGHQIVRVTRGISVFPFFSKMTVLDENDRRIGGIKNGNSGDGELSIFDSSGRSVCRFVVEENQDFYNRVTGFGGWLVDPDFRIAWLGCDFKFMADETELARVTKDWSRRGPVLCKVPNRGVGHPQSIGNSMLEIADCVASDNVVRQLILAAVMCIDMVKPALTTHSGLTP